MVPDVDSYFLAIDTGNDYLIELKVEDYGEEGDPRNRYIADRVDQFHYMRRKNNFLLKEKHTRRSIQVAARQRNMKQLAALIVELDHKHQSQYNMAEAMIEDVADAFHYWVETRVNISSIPVQLRGSLKHFADRHFDRSLQSEFRPVLQEH